MASYLKSLVPNLKARDAGFIACLGVAGLALVGRNYYKKPPVLLRARSSAIPSTSLTKEEQKRRREKKRAKQLEEAYTTACRRRTLSFEQTIGQCVLREYVESAACYGAPILEGFPAQGLAAQLVAQYLVEQLELPLIGEVISEVFPALGVVSHFVTSSGCRIYGDSRLVVFVSDYKLEDEDGSASALYRDMCSVIYEFAERHGSELIMSCEGLPRKSKIDKDEFDNQEDMLAAMLQAMADTKEARQKRMEAAQSSKSPESNEEEEEEEKEDKKKQKKKRGKSDESDDEHLPEDGEVRFICNDPDIAAVMKSQGHEPLRDAMISGVTGAMLSSAPTQSISIICLLSPYDESLADVATAIPLIQAVDTLLGEEICIDIHEMSRDIHRMESAIRKQLEKMVPGATAQDKNLSMYM